MESGQFGSKSSNERLVVVKLVWKQRKKILNIIDKNSRTFNYQQFAFYGFWY